MELANWRQIETFMKRSRYDYYYGDCPPELRPIGAWGYVGLTLLYAIPVIGWIFLIVFTFHNGNLNRRSFTRSYWCALLVLLILVLAITVIGLISGKLNDVVDIITDLIHYKERFGESTHPITSGNEINSSGSGSVSSDFKQFMDSYETFIDEYISFMKTYNASAPTSETLNSYSTYMSKYADFMNRLGAVDTDHLSASDLAYYTSVSLRVEKKLLDASININ